MEYYAEEIKRLKHKADAMVNLGPVLEMFTSSCIQNCSTSACEEQQLGNIPATLGVHSDPVSGGYLYLLAIQTVLLVTNTCREQVKVGASEGTLSEVSRPVVFAELSQSPWERDGTVN